MSKILSILYVLLCLACVKVSAQAVSQAHIKLMLQGLWKPLGNDSLSLAISGDSALDFSMATMQMDLLTCTLSTKPCDNEEYTESPTGYYFTLSSDGETLLCAALVLVNDTQFKLSLGHDKLIIFEKMQ